MTIATTVTTVSILVPPYEEIIDVEAFTLDGHRSTGHLTYQRGEFGVNVCVDADALRAGAVEVVAVSASGKKWTKRLCVQPVPGCAPAVVQAPQMPYPHPAARPCPSSHGGRSLGSAAYRDVGSCGGQVVTLDEDGKLPALDGSRLRNVLDDSPPLLASLTLYVTTAGSDDNDGRSVETALRTWEGARRRMRALNALNASVSVVFGAGQFEGGACTLYNSYSVNITGAAGYGTEFTSRFICERSALALSSVILPGITSTFNANVYGTALKLKGSSGADILVAGTSSNILLRTSVEFAGTCVRAMNAASNGYIEATVPITNDATLNCSSAFMEASAATILFSSTALNSMTAFTGRRYNLLYAGRVQGVTRTQLDAIPGTVAGTINTTAGVN